MKPIDFDAHYAEFAETWIRENMGKYKSIDEMEQQLPGVYLRYLNKPASWLNGEKPADYFNKFGDPDALIAMLFEYEQGGISVPDLLLERIVELGEPAVAPLMALAENADAPESLRATALNLLIEIGSGAPMPLCLQLVDVRAEHDTVADVAAELLEGLGRDAVPAMLERLEGASDAAQQTYLDLLCRYPGDERIYAATLSQFLRNANQRALYASYLGKLGDERATEVLRRALTFSDINYLDYIEIVHAIERITGDTVDANRTFEGDPYYESLKHI